MIDAILRTAGGDGSALAIPRPRQKVFRVVARHFRGPDGTLIEMAVAIATKSRWKSIAWDADSTWTIDVGPLVVAVRLFW